MARNYIPETIDMPLADTEYSIPLLNYNQVVIKARNATAILRVSFITGHVAPGTGAASEKYMTVNPGAAITLDNKDPGWSGTLFVGSGTNPNVAELFLAEAY